MRKLRLRVLNNLPKVSKLGGAGNGIQVWVYSVGTKNLMKKTR